MMRRLALASAALAGLLLGFAGLPAKAADPKLVPDVSSRTIDIKYSFAGEELLLFGAILYPGQRLPSDRADIVVVLKGPVRPIILREKQRVAGIWLNADSLQLRSAPGFYAIGSSAPIDRLLDERTAAIYELGLANLQMSPVGFSAPEKLGRFERGLVDLYRRLGLFFEDSNAVEISDGVLYRARIPVPARVPVGLYRAETYLISKGRVLAVASRPVEIRKTGFERFVALAAQRNGFLYGIAAVLMSVGLGYLAARLFKAR